jgi:hypothetical protein
MRSRPRRCSREKLVIPSWKATTSPSITKSLQGWASSAAASSGNWPVMSRSVRDSSRTGPPSSRWARQRMPSSLRSKIQAGSSKGSSVRTAFIAA